ncbi:MAG: hypothetical protein ACYDA6_03110 [Solirubrobacteraceae bacterium]
MLARVSQREIAVLLKVSPATVNLDVKAMRQEWQREAALDIEEWRAQELASLAADEQAWRARMAQAGDNLPLRLQIYDRVFRIGERRARILGLDQPVRIDIDMLIRQLAVQMGYDPEEAVATAAEVIPAVERLLLKPGRT